MTELRTILHTIESFAAPGTTRGHLEGIAAAARGSLDRTAPGAVLSVWLGNPVAKGDLAPPIEDWLGGTRQLAMVRVDFDGTRFSSHELEALADDLSAALEAGGWSGNCWVLERMSTVRPEGEHAPAGWLQVVMMTVKPKAEAEFNDWYDNEHVDRISRVSGFRGVERFIATRGSPRYVALWSMPTAQESEAPDWLEASQTPWTVRMRASIVDRRRFVMTEEPPAAN